MKVKQTQKPTVRESIEHVTPPCRVRIRSQRLMTIKTPEDAIGIGHNMAKQVSKKLKLHLKA